MSSTHASAEALLRIIGATSILTVASLCGCQAGGSSERVDSFARAAVPIDDVEMHFDPVDRPYTVVALLEAHADTDRFVTVDEATAAAYERLRKMAARAGARAVVEIERTVSRETAEDGTTTGNRLVDVTAKAVVFDRSS